MGFPLALNLRDHHFGVVAYDPAPAMRKKAAREAGIIVVDGEAELVRRLEPGRIIWLMVPAGQATDAAIGALLPYLSTGDVVIDGGNSHYRDSARRHATLKDLGLRFLTAAPPAARAAPGTGPAR